MDIGSNIVATKDDLLNIGITLDKLKEDLTLPNPEYSRTVRFNKGRFYKKIDPYLCYLEVKGDKYIIPRYYVEDCECDNDYRVTGRSLSSHSFIKLRDYQEDFINANLSTINAHSGVLIEAPCGHGKTVMGLWLSYMRGVQTMILVPTYYLAEQWKQRIKEFSDSSVFIVKSTDKEVPIDSDFTIVSLDLFSCRHLPNELVENIGHIILDEAHRVGADTYLPILNEIPAFYRTALTATFRRSDGVHRILKYHFGEHIKMNNRFPKPRIYTFRTNVRIKYLLSKSKKYVAFLDFLDSQGVRYRETKSAIEFDEPVERLRVVLENIYKRGDIRKTPYHEVASCLKRSLEMPYSVVDSYLNEHSGRRKQSIRLIQECLNAGRTVLFLSKRKDILRSLHKYFAKYKPMLIIGDNKLSNAEVEYLQNTCPLIFGVTQLAKEGLDIDRLDTLIIHLPIKDTEQAIGRISRLCDKKRFPIGIYLLDDCPITYAVFNNSKKFMAINAEYKGDISLKNISSVL